MALAILDGTQTATTLSTILSSGQHITAHTVVSLGAQAVVDITSAVSGSVVSIPSLPAISGTVTIGSALPAGTNRIGVVTIGAGTVTIGAGTAQIGTVTAGLSNAVSPTLPSNYTGDPYPVGTKIIPVGGWTSEQDGAHWQALTLNENGFLYAELAQGYNHIGSVTANPTGTQTIAGSVTLGAGTAQIGSVTASISGTVPISISSVTVGNSVTIGSLPAISGSVTANLSISSTAITSGSFASLTSATLVPANTARKMATVYNLGSGQLFVNQGASATTLGGGFMVVLSSGDYFECPFTTTTLSAIFATAGTASWVSH